jgi:hypothetical protein
LRNVLVEMRQPSPLPEIRAAMLSETAICGVRIGVRRYAWPDGVSGLDAGWICAIQACG